MNEIPVFVQSSELRRSAAKNWQISTVADIFIFHI